MSYLNGMEREIVGRVKGVLSSTGVDVVCVSREGQGERVAREP